MNQDIELSINKIKNKIGNLKIKQINESQTKEWLIKPFFAAIGWDFSNPDEVIPEDKDLASKRTDYSFYINKKPKLLIEAKSLNNNLDDNKMIMEKLNYCSNSGTPLLIITNGDLYRIYFADLKGIGKDKLLREFCLSDNIDEEIIDMLSRTAFEKNLLLNYSKNISLLTNAKNVIEKLFLESNKSIINLINEGLREKIGYKFHDDEIKKALKNISLEINTINSESLLDKSEDLKIEAKKTSKEEIISLNTNSNPSMNNISSANTTTITNSNTQDNTYTIEHHFKNGLWNISFSLFNQLVKYLQSNNLVFDVKPVKYYINFLYNDKSFCRIISQKNCIKLYYILIKNELSEYEVLQINEVSEYMNFGNFKIELKIDNPNQFELAFSLLKKSYNKLK